MSDMINVFVKLDMSGKGTKAFHLSKSTKISELKEKVNLREGVEIDILTFRSKPTRDHLKLSDYDCYNNCHFFASLRLKGGAQAEGTNATKFNEFEVAKLAGKHGASVVTTNCMIGGSDGCYESMVKKCKLKCGCIYCPDCIRMTLSSQIDIGGVLTLCCGSSNCGKKPGGTKKGVPIDTSLAFAIAAFNDSKKAEYDAKMDENGFKKPTAEMSICPKCKKFMTKKRKDSTLLEKCIHCNSEMCWICKQPGPHNDPMDCTPIAEVASVLNNFNPNDEKYVTVDGCPTKVYSKRVCPNKECHQVNRHKEACRHMTCGNCNYQYCHICLKPWAGHPQPRSSCNDKVAPKQNCTAKALFYD